LARLRALQPGIGLEVVSANPEFTSKKHGIPSVSGYDPRALLAAGHRSDLIVLGGGGLFHDYWGFDPDSVMTDRAAGMSYYSTAAVLSAICCKPLLLYAVGAGPLDSLLGREHMRFVLQTASLVTVRDAGTSQMFVSMGVPAEKVIVTADPAFDLKDFTPIPAERRSLPLVGVSLRRWNDRVSQQFWESEIAKALDCFRQRQEVEFVFLPFDTNPYDPDPDYQVLRRVRDQMTFRNAVTLAPQDIDFMEVRGWISRCSLMVGMRLHSLIFAATLGVPFAGIVYDPKLPGVFDMAPFNSCLLLLNGMDANLLARKMQQIYQHREELIADLSFFVSAQRQSSIQMAKAMRPFLLDRVSYSPLDRVFGRFTQSRIEDSLDARAAARHARDETSSLAARIHAVQGESDSRKAERDEIEGRLTTEIVRLNEQIQSHYSEQESAVERENSLRLQLRSLQTKSPRGLVKRQLQVLLDLGERITPAAIRRTARGWYLNHVYYRIYPEARRALSQPLANSVHPELLQLKAHLRQGLSLGYEAGALLGNPLVSVILPVFNGEPFLASSIESVLNQRYRNLELIIVDDGSSDSTPDTLQRYAADSRVRVLRQPNQRLPAALNAGFGAARGELWTWTSADNLMAPECVSTLVDFLRRRPDVELVYANQALIGEDGQPLTGTDFNSAFQTPPGSANIHWPEDPGRIGFGTHNYLGACWLYRAWTGRLMGPHVDEVFGFEDFEYWMRMNIFFRMAHLDRPDVLYYYRLHPKSLTSRSAQLNLTSRVVHFIEMVEPDRHRAYQEPCRFALIGESPHWGEVRSLLERTGHEVVRDLAKGVSCALFSADSLRHDGAWTTLRRKAEQAGIECRVAITRDLLRDDEAAWLTMILCESDAVCRDLQHRGFYRTIRWRESHNMIYPLLALVRNERGVRMAREGALSWQ
jgi:polysaccharide pyruvyl transferase CsaB